MKLCAFWRYLFPEVLGHYTSGHVMYTLHRLQYGELSLQTFHRGFSSSVLCKSKLTALKTSAKRL